ncbi:hypothetical protein CEXT_1641 [Caerostris extrusa]|uniref:Uncharacterized protein n=1 Tax=Caerostris extrusa TaxID=172846 RepID=A0AAV4XJ09_CAEEX|nr:hypothetical protein CEXT_1641 [Caerostris extrusa]
MADLVLKKRFYLMGAVRADSKEYRRNTRTVLRPPLFRSEPLSHQHLQGRRFGDAGVHECREIPIQRGIFACTSEKCNISSQRLSLRFYPFCLFSLRPTLTEPESSHRML